MINFGIVGTGWRAHFFLRIAKACPDRFNCVGVVTRDPQKAAPIAEQYGVKLYPALDDLLTQKPLFVVTSVPWPINPGLLHQLADANMPALSETPPAPTVEEMAEHVNGGDPVYPLEEACQDHYLSLCMQQAQKEGKAI
ncbi:MAG: Gfo/Idh/MocA family oxidoreductase, partial [Candidatus Latescibacteria bacterium]|nr:Gfo/Idh/MocA family oxidoreductase [Candidatus Latescibacterota bacterium]